MALWSTPATASSDEQGLAGAGTREPLPKWTGKQDVATVYAEIKKQNMPTLLISYIRRFLLWHALTGCRTRGSRHLGYDYFEHY